ncbi:MAG: sensor domain-containing diguanylate cyclase [Desulfamplus sp.]|nr:sensor domain-containing diguanylate cyclase [Desulfamplus sp.]MBF0411774.1 sensor domain-containing diguanylate cyclase [Desulfamplus sp.]
MDKGIMERINNASFFLEIGKPLAKAKTIKDTLEVLMYQIGTIFQPMNWSLLLKDPKSGDMIFTIVVGANKEKLEGVRIPKGEGIAGHILNTGDSLIVENVEEDKRFSMRMDESTGFKTKSIIGVPLKTDDKIFGVIELINKISGHNFTQFELTLLSTIAEYAAIAIERSYYNQALKKIALTDSLTGLKNRNSFERTLNNRVEMLKRYGVISSLLIIDIKDFKQINSKYGHTDADKVLREFALMLRNMLRAVDEIFRYSGDKFTVIMPQTSLDKAEQAKLRILTKLTSEAFLDGKVNINVTVGIRLIDEETTKEILNFVNKKNPLSPSSISQDADVERMESNLKPLLDEENISEDMVEQRKVRYKDVMLAGDYTHYSKNDHGHITVKKLSMKGIDFEIMRQQHKIEPDDILDVTFTLDDSKRSLIKRRVRIDAVKDKYIVAQFYNPPPYDKNLGFYFMA